MNTLNSLFAHHGGDKGIVHSYIDVYEQLLAKYRMRHGNILEIGLFKGESFRMWEEYFAMATVYGIDLNDQPVGGMADLRPLIAEGNHRIVFCDANNPAHVEQHFHGIDFEVIIEDASHEIESQFAIYKNFRDHLAPGGLYVIEDVQDIDATRERFEKIDPERSVEIVDRRGVKGRYDDVLVLIRGNG